MILRLAAILGLFGVILGALGAHLLKPRLLQLATLPLWETALFFHFIHSVALLCLASHLKSYARLTALCFFIGVLAFSGSLYLLASTGAKWLGAITPIGGLLLLLGWGMLLFTRAE